MKRMFFSMVLAFVTMVVYSQDIKGKWITEAADA